jgi:hypothetical protein
MTTVFYFIFLLSFSIFSYLFIDQNFAYLKDLYSGFAFTNRQQIVVLYSIFILAFFYFYSQFIRKIKTLPKLKIIIGISIAVLIFSYPAFLSFDIFNYIATAKTLFFYGENPYIVMPIEFEGDSLLSFTHAANKIALYGPLWVGLTAIPFFLGLGNYLLTVISFKIFIALFFIGATYLIWRISNNIFSVSLFALNPLVLIETFMSSHNDIVMMFFAILAFYLLKKKKLSLSFIFILASILIKYATVLLIPVFIYATIKIIKKEDLDWDKIFLISFFSMSSIFLLSHFREEIYPWYAIWFLPFAALVPNKKIILYISLAFSLGLLFRYTPFMLYGTHFGTTPFVKNLVTFVPPLVALIYFKDKWLKNFH